MVPLPSSSISFNLTSTSSSLTLSPSPLSKNFKVLLVIFPELFLSYILNISFNSSICSTLYELNFYMLWIYLSVPIMFDFIVDLRDLLFDIFQDNYIENRKSQNSHMVMIVFHKLRMSIYQFFKICPKVFFILLT